MNLISILVPCYNEEETIQLFLKEMQQVNNKIKHIYPNTSFETIFIDDGSSDNSLEILRKLNKKHDDVLYISFSRNFGKEAAIYAGLKKARGDFIFLLDGDLQHPPEFLIPMYEALKNNSNLDCIAGKRTRTGDPAIRTWFSKQFYKMMNRLSEVSLIDGVGDFRLMTRKMTNAVLEMGEGNRFSKGMFSWVGFNVDYIEYNNVIRVAGNTKWSFSSLFKYSLEGLFSFSTKPLYIASFLGIAFFFISIIMIIFIVLKTLVFGDPVAGYPSLICAIFMLGGLQLFCTGILGQYLAKTYLEVKNRPVYITKETVTARNHTKEEA